MTGWGRGALWLVLALVLAGCAGTRNPYEDMPPSPETVRSFLGESFANVDSLRSTLRVRVQTGEFAGSLFGSLYLRSPDGLALSLRAPFGIPVGDIIVSDGLYEATLGNGRFETGAVEEFDLRAMTGIPLPSEDVLRLFEPLARPVADSLLTVAFTVTGSDSLWRWRLAEASLEHEILFDPEAPRVVEERWIDSFSGVQLLRKQYLEPVHRHGVAVASKLALESGGATPTTVDITFDDLELNPAWTSDPFLRRSNDPPRSDPGLP